MDRDIFSTEASSITAEACAWIAQLETGELTAADQEAFREWIGRSPRHAAEIKQQAVMSKELNVLSGMTQSINEAADTHRAAVSRSGRKTVFPFGAVAFASAILFGFLVLFNLYAPINSPTEVMLYSTSIGEYQEFVLEDGSVIKLNTDSQIEVTFDRYNRRVRLLSGEAFFDVTPNTDRPFWVYARDQYVRVVGTAFLVSLIDKNFELMVTEGRVELAINSDSIDTLGQSSGRNLSGETTQLSTNPIALVAGQSVSVSDSTLIAPVQTVSERDQRRELSWQEGLHDFSNTSLEAVVAELSRYSTTKIEITDPALGELKFGGVFRIGDTQQLFEALETAYGVEIGYLNDNSVTLSLLQ